MIVDLVRMRTWKEVKKVGQGSSLGRNQGCLTDAKPSMEETYQYNSKGDGEMSEEGKSSLVVSKRRGWSCR